MTLPSGTRLGSYEVLAPLGAGGMGEVYRARDARLSREVALKVLPQEVSADRRRLSRFEQEGRSVSALNHPNIVTVYEVGQSGEIAYIAMELVEGRTLRDLLRDGPLPIKRVLAVGAQTAEGLAKAHAAGIVHRDLKPENLMVSKDGYVKILDFGLSKLAAPESDRLSAAPTRAETRTESGTVLGTVPYMSPEQASGKPVDYRSDQFSLGSILYEAACGRRPFQKTTAAETMTSIIRDEPEPLAKVRPDVPVPLRWIVERCLAKDPDERYASTRDLARDLASLRDRISEATSAAEALVAAPVRKGKSVPVAGGLALLALGLVSGWALRNGISKTSVSAPRFHRLTFRRGDIYNARFAPDGQTVLYGAGWVGDKQRLYLTRPQSPESSTVDLGDGSYDILAVSPSGELAIRGHFDDVLSRVPMAGGTPRQVTTGILYAGADWAPDGNDLAVVRNVGGRTRLEYPIGKVLLESTEHLGAPRFSPDGLKIAFFEQTGGSFSVNVVETSGKGRKALSAGWASYEGAPCWTPAGKEIWFTASQQSEGAAIHAVDLAGKLRLVTRAPGMLELDDISREGRVLAAHHVMARVLMGRRAGDEKDRDLSWLDESLAADLSADGRTLLFDETGQGGGAAGSVYMRKTDGSAAVRLGEGFGAALSPDGARVIAGRSRPTKLFVLPTGPGQPIVLPGEHLDVIWVNWLPDSRRIVFSARMKDGTRTFIQDVEGRPPRPLGPEGMQLAPFTNTVSPDGKVFVAHTADGKVVLFPVEDGEMHEAKGLNPGDRPIRWTADGRLLYVFRRGESPARIFLVDPVTGNRTLFKEISPAEPTSTFSELLVTPDGKGYVYSFARTAADLNIIEGLR